jgi:hypothetical protein
MSTYNFSSSAVAAVFCCPVKIGAQLRTADGNQIQIVLLKVELFELSVLGLLIEQRCQCLHLIPIQSKICEKSHM